MAQNEIKGFTGKYYPLSNYSFSEFSLDGYKYTNAEAAFHSYKNKDYQPAFHKLNPKDAKILGRRVKLRDDWEEIKDEVMYNVIKAKFIQCQSCKELLLSTGDAYLEETNTWNDKYWGVCNGEGKNKLGKLLMRLRTELVEGKFDD